MYGIVNFREYIIRVTEGCGAEEAPDLEMQKSSQKDELTTCPNWSFSMYLYSQDVCC